MTEPADHGTARRDADLVRAALGGDREAFGVLFVRHRRTLAALCRSALGGDGSIEDAVQEAALQGMLSLGSLRRPERFGPWLCGIGLNVCRRRLRERSREAWSWEALAGGLRVPEPVDAGPDPADRAEEAEVARRVRGAVVLLPPGQRAAVLLVYLAGLTQAQAAAALGAREGAVKTRLHKARASLRRALADEWREDEMTTERTAAPVAMEIVDVRRRPAQSGEDRSMYVIVLRERDGGRWLPIWVGPTEGIATALLLEKVEHNRPLTYAFMAAALRAAGGST